MLVKRHWARERAEGDFQSKVGEREGRISEVQSLEGGGVGVMARAEVRRDRERRMRDVGSVKRFIGGREMVEVGKRVRFWLWLCSYEQLFEAESLTKSQRTG